MPISKVMIIGSGLMGSGIAQVCAQSGLKVILMDTQAAALDRALKNISWSVGKMVEKGKVPGTVEEIMARIKTAHGYEQAREADLCIEAVFENQEIKEQVFKELDRSASSKAVLATNTSAISISALASAISRPGRFLGLHFFSPVPMMPAAEVIKGAETEDRVFETGLAFIQTLGKEPIPVRRDIPGFVINRINYRANLEAMRLVEDGVATVAEIDQGLRLASGRKMGPFEIGDLVGLDVTHGALLAIYEETRDPYWYPPPNLRRKVKAGHLGRKTGKGWYEYNPDGSRKG